MMTALLQWIDAEQLFAVLLEQEPVSVDSPLPVAGPPALSDQILLKKLVPPDLYREAIQAGWMGMHALSFALRHRVTQLQWLFHQSQESMDKGLQQCLLESWQRRYGPEQLPIFGFSPLGIHCSRRRRGLCRAFDAFSLWTCAQETAGIFCQAHEMEAFWTKAEGGTQQAMMFRYYASLENFSLYGEQDLERMLGAFWERYRVYSAEDLAQAMKYFGFRDGKELRDCGPSDLRRKFLQLSLIHHPDRGGDESVFVILQAHYHRLKRYLETG